VVGMSALSGQADPLRFVIAAVAVAAIAVAVTISIRRGVVLEDPADDDLRTVDAAGSGADG